MTSTARPTQPYVPGVDTSDDLRDRAYEILPPALFNHIVGGAGQERTMASNRAGFGLYRLLPRVLTDVRSVDTRVLLLGSELTAPIFVSPTGGIGGVYPDGELAVARAAAEVGVGYALSGAAGVTIEDVAAVAGPARWYQLYWQGSGEIMVDLVRRAEDAGYPAIVLTVDNAVRPRRRRMLRGGYSMPASAATANLARYLAPEWQERVEAGQRGRTAQGLEPDLALVWEHVAWLRTQTRLPFLLKGIMGAPDAVRAMEIGADGIIISNHGGRNLDGEPGTIEVLEEIRVAVGPDAIVMLDGGVRSATDAVIALGLGADAVGLGSPVVWALACGGEAVVSAFLEHLVEDVGRTLGMLGVATVGELTRQHVSRKGEFVPDWALGPYAQPAYE